MCQTLQTSPPAIQMPHESLTPAKCATAPKQTCDITCSDEAARSLSKHQKMDYSKGSAVFRQHINKRAAICIDCGAGFTHKLQCMKSQMGCCEEIKQRSLRRDLL